MICIECAESLKKNLRIKIEAIPELQDILESEVNISPSFYTFKQLIQKYKKTDYLAKHKRQIEIGDLGEAYVLDREYEKLINTKYFDMIEDKSVNASNGYDILSFEKKDGTELYIEVKTSEFIGIPFYMSEPERKIAEQFLNEEKNYVIYRIENILADNIDEIKCTKINDIFNTSSFIFQPISWKITPIV